MAMQTKTMQYVRLADIHVDNLSMEVRTRAANQLYLVKDVLGLSRDALRQLAFMHPVIVHHENEQLVPIANLRTLALLKTGLHEEDEIPVLEVQGHDPRHWEILESLVSPLLQALDPDSAFEQLDTTCRALSRAEIKACWNGVHTTSGLSRALGIPRLNLYRKRRERPPDGTEPSERTGEST